MGPLRYHTIMRQSKESICLRLEVVRYAREHGVKPAARPFGTTPKTVRKWLTRWRQSAGSAGSQPGPEAARWCCWMSCSSTDSTPGSKGEV